MEKYPAITLGATLAERVKRLYFEHEPWAKVSSEVARRVRVLKEVGRTYMPDRDEVARMHWLCGLNKADMDEALAMNGREARQCRSGKDGSQPENTGELMATSLGMLNQNN